MKVLVSAYACEPDKGSEPGVGWNWVKQIARFHETWVITRANNRESIERELKGRPVDDLHLVYYDLPKWLSFWKKGPKGMHLYYFLWQLGSWRIAKKLNGLIHFDIVHHITFGSIFLPTFMPLIDVPFVWGPLGGAEQIPPPFRKKWGLGPRLKENLREFFIRTLALNPFFGLPFRRASLILSKTEDTARQVTSQHAAKVVVICDVGISPLSASKDGGMNDVLLVLLVGSLDPWRGFDLALRSFALAAEKIEKMNLVILGTGREMVTLRQLAAQLGIQDRVLFAGKVPYDQYRKYLLESDIVMNPCLKEGGVTVLFDSLLCGKPVVCFDLAGSSRIITEECGIRIKLSTPETVVEELGRALERLACDPPLRARMGEAGQSLVQTHHGWDKKGEFMREAYANIIRVKHEDLPFDSSS